VIFLLVAAAVVVAAPLAAAVLVTVASLREDSARSLARRPPGLLTAAARRLLRLRTNAGSDEGRPHSMQPADKLFLSRVDLQVPLPRSEEGDQSLTMPRS
jgi:hypothetical protein